MEESDEYITAEDLMRQLESNPEWVRKRDERQQRRKSRRDKWRENQRPLVEDLKAAGYDVETVWDFVGRESSYDSAIPVLVDHLSRDYQPHVREGIVRALTLRSAREAAGELLQQLFESEREPSVEFALANALSVMFSYEEVDHLKGITHYRKLF